MAIPSIDTYTEYESTAAVSSFDMDRPASIVAGKLLLLIVGNEDSTTTQQFTNNITGFTLVDEIGNGTSDNHIALYYRKATGDANDPNPVTVTTQSSDYAYGWYVQLNDADADDPINFITAGIMQSSAPINITGATPDEDNVLCFAHGGLDGADGGAGTIAGTGWSKWRSIECTAGGSSGASGVIGTRGIASQTASGTCTADWSVSDGTAGWQFGINEGISVPQINSCTPDEFDDEETGIVVAGQLFGASQGSGDIELGDNVTYGSANLQSQTVTAWGDTEITITCDLGTLGPGTRWLFVTPDGESPTVGFEVTVHRAQAFIMSASSYIAVSGENTTAQLTAPTSGSFGGGRIQDDENPTDAVDIAVNEYREDEWCMQAKTAAEDAAQYEFRITLSGVAIDTYTIYPKWTIGTGVSEIFGSASLSATGEITDVPSIVTVFGASAMSATGVITNIDAHVIVFGSAALSAVGVIEDIPGVVTRFGTAALSATGTLENIPALVTQLASAALSAQGTLVDIPSTVTVFAVATMVGDGTLQCTAYLTIPGSATLSATGLLEATGGIQVTGAASLSAVGSITDVPAFITRFGVASLSATGLLEGSGIVEVQASSSISATGALDATGKVIVFGAAALSAIGLLEAEGDTGKFGEASLEAIGTLIASGTVTKLGSAALSATGTLDAAAIVTVKGAAALSALGILEASGVVSKIGSATLSATGTLENIPATVTVYADSSISAIGDLSADAILTIFGSANLIAVGILTAKGSIEGEAYQRKRLPRWFVRNVRHTTPAQTQVGQPEVDLQ